MSPSVVVQGDAERTWVWSDLHLNHEEIIKQCRRPFTTGGEMNEALPERWRRHVRPGDTMVNGGDAAWPGTLSRAFRERIGRLSGRRVLVGRGTTTSITGARCSTTPDDAAHDVVTGARGL